MSFTHMPVTDAGQGVDARPLCAASSGDQARRDGHSSAAGVQAGGCAGARWGRQAGRPARCAQPPCVPCSQAPGAGRAGQQLRRRCARLAAALHRLGAGACALPPVTSSPCLQESLDFILRRLSVGLAEVPDLLQLLIYSQLRELHHLRPQFGARRHVMQPVMGSCTSGQGQRLCLQRGDAWVPL
jgi:hypothetical protein